MPRFAYEATTAAGQVMHGTMDATSPSDLIARLRGMGYFPTHIEEAAPEVKRRLRLGTGIRAKEIEFFTLQMATLVNAGVQIDRALRVCGEQMPNPYLRQVVEQIRYDVEHGSSFADALGRHPKLFSPLYVNMVEAGQAGGVLGVVLQRLADFTKQQRELRDSVTSALIYPMILLGFVGLIIVALTFFVIPRFVVMFQDVGVALPIYTRLLIGGVDFVRSPYGVAWVWSGIPLPGVLLTILVIAAVSARQYSRTEAGKRVFDRLRMKLPLAGNVVRNFALVRLMQTMSTLMENGVTLLPALRIAKDTVGSVSYEEALGVAASEIERGSNLSGPLSESGLFPPIVTDMLAIGEESGEPEQMLARLAEYYDREIKRSLERMVAALGPLLILFMAGIVVFIALAIVLPIFNLSQMLR
ncbi:type II secretion system F family protein [Candidatus Poribacteria bacterium]|nr:type II secretion system F family protein [Candidatus Poribacteria bacterium]